MVSSGDARQMDLKVIVRKSNGEIVFVEADDDFADILFSFLTFPLGGVLHMIEGFTLGSLNNIHQSVKELSSNKYLISHDLKDKLVKPKVAPQFDLTHQILPIGAAASLPVFYCHPYIDDYYRFCVNLTREKVVPMHSQTSYFGVSQQFSFVDPKSSSSNPSSSRGFAKGASRYMVTNDLVVTPMSSTSALSYLNRSKVPLSELEEKVIKIGMNEGLDILKASLISATALTDGLSQLITTIKDSAKRRRIIKEDK